MSDFQDLDPQTLGHSRGDNSVLDIAIMNATLITMDNHRRVLRDATIGVLNGSMATIEVRAEVNPPARETIDEIDPGTWGQVRYQATNS